MMPKTEDWFERVLRTALAAPTQGSEVSASDTSPIPSTWQEELLARVAQRSSDLLAHRICERAELVGWGLDNLAEEARDCSEAARGFLRHGGDPRCLTPKAFARLFWCLGLSPADWQDLLRQSVSAFAVTLPSPPGTLTKQATGSSGSVRAEVLGGAGGSQRDPEQAIRMAELFVDVVMGEWRTLSTLCPSPRSVKERGSQKELLSNPGIASTTAVDCIAGTGEVVVAIEKVLKVSADSKPKAVAGALAAVLREKGSAELQAVGAGAVNQAVKAIAITRGFVAPNGIDLFAVPAFTEVEIEGEERTAIRFLVKSR